VVADLDARSVLLDPKGAWVGSVLLGACLVVIIVVGFFHIDVWKISLPFAVTKLIFDLVWDHYRFAHEIPMLGHLPKRRSEDGREVVEPVGNGEEIMLENLQRRITKSPRRVTQNLPSTEDASTSKVDFNPELEPSPLPTTATNIRSSTISTNPTSQKSLLSSHHAHLQSKRTTFTAHFPTVSTAWPRLPFALVPFAFSQFILIEGLSHQGWIDIFSSWLRHATAHNPNNAYPAIWLVGVLGIILCNLSGTNIGCTILMAKVIRAAELPPHTERAAAIALAVASNIGAVSFTFSASLAGLLWRGILKQKGILISQGSFAYWNTVPVVVMGVVGFGVVCAEMAVVR